MMSSNYGETPPSLPAPRPHSLSLSLIVFPKTSYSLNEYGVFGATHNFDPLPAPSPDSFACIPTITGPICPYKVFAATPRLQLGKYFCLACIFSTRN